MSQNSLCLHQIFPDYNGFRGGLELERELERELILELELELAHK